MKNGSRIFRVCMLFEIFRRWDALNTTLITLQMSLKEIAVFITYLCVGILVFATLLYEIENINDSDTTFFTNIPLTCW